MTERARSAPFVCRPDDVFIASYPRSGTTWLQMAVHSLMRPAGDSFVHISQAIPFFERALREGRSLEAPAPRIFKTHLHYRHAPKGAGKLLYIARDGRDVLVSYFHFHRAYLSSTDSFDTFFDRFIEGNVLYGSWFRHVRAWLAEADDSHVLVVRYEELAARFQSTLRRIAVFLDRPCAAAQAREIEERCSFARMRAVETTLDPLTERGLETGDPVDPALAAALRGMFLRRGEAGRWPEVLTTSQVARFDRALRECGLSADETTAGAAPMASGLAAASEGSR